MTSKRKREWRQIHIRLPVDLYDLMEEYLRTEGSFYGSINEFIRSLVATFFGKKPEIKRPERQTKDSTILLNIDVIKDFLLDGDSNEDREEKDEHKAD